MNDQGNGPEAGIDTQLLAEFLYELNVAQRHVSAYPSEHPVILHASQKVLGLLSDLVHQQTELTLGVTRDALLFGQTRLERQHTAYRALARRFFDHGIAAVTFQRGLQAGELRRFNELLTRKPEALRQEGGIDAAATAAGIERIVLRPIDYSAFRGTEEERIGGGTGSAEEADSLWDGFIRGVLSGSLDRAGEPVLHLLDLDPQKLTEQLKRQFQEASGPSQSRYRQSLTQLLRQLQEGQGGEGVQQGVAERFTALIEALPPELRRQLLTISCQALAENPQAAEAFLGRLPESLLCATLEGVGADGGAIPPVILTLLDQLTRHGRTGGARAVADSDTQLSEQEKLRLLFREGEEETFIPADYRAQLDAMAVAGKGASGEDTVRAELRQTLRGHCVETEAGNVILELAQEGDPSGALLRNLHELCAYFLEMGDFTALIRLHNRLQGDVLHTAGSALAREVLADFSRPAFTGEVLDGLRLWGKAKYGEIETLMRTVGAPFVAPLLERLAAEKNVSLRRYYLNRLVEFGAAAGEAALRRLDDGRWYFVRNLLVLLRQLGDLAAVPAIRPLLKHAHPRVRQEALSTLLYFHDEEAGAFLLRELEQTDTERRLAALALAGKSFTPAVFNRLLDLIRHGGLGAEELEIRRATVRSLGELGDPAALPVLSRVLRRRSLFRPRQNRKLKEEIIRSLPHYPASSVQQILEEFCGGRGELARLAGQGLKSLQGRLP